MCVCVRTCSGVPPVAFERCLSFFPSLCSVAQLCLTLFNPRDCSTPGLPVHHQLLSLFKLMSIESVMPSNHLILCRPLLLPPSVFPSIRVFSNESVLRIRWPKCWSFSLSISPSNGYSGLISLLLSCVQLFASPQTVAHQAPLSVGFSR